MSNIRLLFYLIRAIYTILEPLREEAWAASEATACHGNRPRWI